MDCAIHAVRCMPIFFFLKDISAFQFLFRTAWHSSKWKILRVYHPLIELGSIFLLSQRVSFHLTLSFHMTKLHWNDTVRWNDTLCDSRKMAPYLTKLKKTLYHSLCYKPSMFQYFKNFCIWLLLALQKIFREDFCF